jgi:hypothetical protein
LSPALENKIRGMFWDMSPEIRDNLIHKIMLDPVEAFNDEQILSRALNTLNWYDLVNLIGIKRLQELLNDRTIRQLFPKGRQKYYKNAKRLLSKYLISPAG